MCLALAPSSTLPSWSIRPPPSTPLRSVDHFNVIIPLGTLPTHDQVSCKERRSPLDPNGSQSVVPAGTGRRNHGALRESLAAGAQRSIAPACGRLKVCTCRHGAIECCGTARSRAVSVSGIPAGQCVRQHRKSGKVASSGEPPPSVCMCARVARPARSSLHEKPGRQWGSAWRRPTHSAPRCGAAERPPRRHLAILHTSEECLDALLFTEAPNPIGRARDGDTARR